MALPSHLDVGRQQDCGWSSHQRARVRSAASVAQGYMAAMDLGLEARYKDVRTS